MIDRAGNPKVLEFNCRLGDPETQPILLRLKCDLLDADRARARGQLDRVEAEWDRARRSAWCSPRTAIRTSRARAIRSGAARRRREDCRVFHAGTRLDGKSVVTSGGRVLCVTALGDSVKMARTRAYEAVERIRFDGMQYRRDIGHRAIEAQLALPQ